MPLGAHLPTAKGFPAALQQARTLGCDCLQIFSKSPRIWNAAPLDPVACTVWRELWRDSKSFPLVVHDSYLINLATPDEAARRKSIDAMIAEVERADLLGCDWLVTHCGAHLQKSTAPRHEQAMTPQEESGLQRLAAALHEVLAATPEARVKIALENTAAQGTCLGGPFEHLQFLQDALPAERIGFCFDTCHAFAAGHDLASAEAVQSTLARFDALVGIENIAVVHLNDSQGALGRHLDRHAHIGEGQIGRDGMRALLQHPQLRDKPFILETPESETMIATNLQTVRELQKNEAPHETSTG